MPKLFKKSEIKSTDSVSSWTLPKSSATKLYITIKISFESKLTSVTTAATPVSHAAVPPSLGANCWCQGPQGGFALGSLKYGKTSRYSGAKFTICLVSKKKNDKTLRRNGFGLFFKQPLFVVNQWCFPKVLVTSRVSKDLLTTSIWVPSRQPRSWSTQWGWNQGKVPKFHSKR